jgi:hypothetical protein
LIFIKFSFAKIQRKKSVITAFHFLHEVKILIPRFTGRNEEASLQVTKETFSEASKIPVNYTLAQGENPPKNPLNFLKNPKIMSGMV